MSHTRFERIRLLAQENRSRRLAPQFLRDLSAVVGTRFSEADFVPLDQVRSLLAKRPQIYQSAKPALRRIVLAQDFSVVTQVLSTLASGDRERRVLYTSRRTASCGAIYVALGNAVDRVQELIDLDGDDIWVFADMTASNGFMVDYFEDWVDQQAFESGAPRLWQYELVVWGSDWARQLDRT